jgi:hypothetical protein
MICFAKPVLIENCEFSLGREPPFREDLNTDSEPLLEPLPGNYY